MKTPTICPLCGAGSADPVSASIPSVPELAAIWRERYGVDPLGALEADRISLLECQQCHLQYFVPSPTGDAAMYAALADAKDYYMTEKWEFDIALQELRGMRGTLLEVGCGDGHFLQKLAGLEGIEAIGIEMSSQSVERAQKSGLSVTGTSLEELLEDGRRYDAIATFQVLEHVPNPADFLEKCCALLADGGKLIISVPNRHSFLQLAKSNVLDLPPHHLTRWGKAPFQWMTSRFPVALSALRCEPLAPMHDAWYAETVCSHVPGGWRLEKVVRGCLKLGTRIGLRRLIKGHTLYVSFVRVPVAG